MFRGDRCSTLLFFVMVLTSLATTESRRRGVDAYDPECKEGSPQKQKTVRRCCVERRVEKKCRRLCTTHQHKHVFVGASLCSFKYDKVIQACHCGIPAPAPRIAAVTSQCNGLLPWKHNKLLIVVLGMIPLVLQSGF